MHAFADAYSLELKVLIYIIQRHLQVLSSLCVCQNRLHILRCRPRITESEYSRCSWWGIMSMASSDCLAIWLWLPGIPPPWLTLSSLFSACQINADQNTADDTDQRTVLGVSMIHIGFNMSAGAWRRPKHQAAVAACLAWLLQGVDLTLNFSSLGVQRRHLGLLSVTGWWFQICFYYIYIYNGIYICVCVMSYYVL